MNLLTSIGIQNFKCYRRRQTFNLTQSNFFVGTNNAGKSAVLKALHCFFDDSQYHSEFINKTELRSRGSGYNKTTIDITFDFNAISTKTLKERLKRQFGESLTVFKSYTFRENTNTILIDYTIQKEVYLHDTLPTEIIDLFSKISVSYIHPQEAQELLEKAQEKLKKRLLTNWGRNATLKDTLWQLAKPVG